jgi:oligoendopeptidase F
MDHLLDKEKDPGLRRDILAETMDSIYATVLRQAFFVLFEREAHGLVSGGKTIDALHGAYMENLGAQFGGSVEVDEVFRHEWTGIPHIFHYPFYCYAYSFGMLLSLSLYRRYRKEGGGFRETLFRILRYGGSESPARILEGAGIDISGKGFWRGGFRAIEDMVKALEETG